MSQHVPSLRSYVAVYGMLLALTALTVFARHLPLGMSHTIVALLIAGAKAALILLFFMHLLHSPRLTWVVALSGLVWLAILLELTMADYVTR
jgi:cytochrome c oxidase subunit 4